MTNLLLRMKFEKDDLCIRSQWDTVALLLERLSTVYQPSLGVLSSVDKVWVVKCELHSAVDDVVDCLYTQHETVILVADLVSPRAESATRPDALLLELGQELSENAFTLKRRSWVTVVESAVVGGNDLVSWLELLSVDQALNAVCEQGLLVDWLHAGFGDLKHNAPVWSLLCRCVGWLATIRHLLCSELDGCLWLVVWRVVGEDCRAVEWAVVLWEVEPALVADTLWTLTTDTNTNDVGSGVEETLAQVLKLLVLHGLNEVVDGHGGDELAVVHGSAVTEEYSVVLSIHKLDLTVLAKASLVLLKSLGDLDPDVPGSTLCWEAESGVWTPVSCGLVQDDVLGDQLKVWSSDTLAEPCSLHLSKNQLSALSPVNVWLLPLW